MQRLTQAASFGHSLSMFIFPISFNVWNHMLNGISAISANPKLSPTKYGFSPSCPSNTFNTSINSFFATCRSSSPSVIHIFLVLSYTFLSTKSAQNLLENFMKPDDLIERRIFTLRSNYFSNFTE
ncbi:hypothetical protein HanXRQr2_Chr04g0191571 [Helianthus annuus]|uniref:Uncharacterized protein n=1 Tax=Helianthus annuus TaxID=4232 RepID=A0A9K3NUZ4_HELAN|nr:hypothetical protein HanXRQr2_Chr04g0191571 [Helianthus annuus]